MQSPACNRVTPLGDIVAIPLRGAWLGNRGILHRGTEVVRFHRSPLWIICALQHKDWRLPQWQPHHFTVLFFHDEAVALAAGHRPVRAVPPRGLQRLPQRGLRRHRRGAAAGVAARPPAARRAPLPRHPPPALHELPWSQLPDGAFVLADDGPALVDDDAIVPWTTAGYGPRPARARAPAASPRSRRRRRCTRCATATARRSAPVHGPLVGLRHPRRSGRVAEGARLLSGYGGSTSIAGSNPAFSAYLLRIAHRGYAAQGGENSLATIAAALALGCDMVEVDVRRRRDGVLVLAPRRRQPARRAAAGRRAAPDRRDVAGAAPTSTSSRARPARRSSRRCARAGMLGRTDLHRRRLGGAGAHPRRRSPASASASRSRVADRRCRGSSASPASPCARAADGAPPSPG